MDTKVEPQEQRSGIEEGNLLVLEAVPAGSLETGIKTGLIEVLRTGLDDSVAHRLLDAAAGTLTFELHHLVVERHHLDGDGGAVEVKPGGNGGINTTPKATPSKAIGNSIKRSA